MKDGNKFVWKIGFNDISSAEKAIDEDYERKFNNCSEETEKYQIISCNRVIKTIYVD